MSHGIVHASLPCTLNENVSEEKKKLFIYRIFRKYIELVFTDRVFKNKSILISYLEFQHSKEDY